MTPQEIELNARIRMLSAIPEEFYWCDLKDAEWLASVVAGGEKQVDLAKQAYAAMEDLDGVRRITLVGRAGVGKTVLGSAIFRKLVLTLDWREVGVDMLDDMRADSLWLDAAELGRKAAVTKKHADVVSAARRAPVLVLDDLGSEAIYGTRAIATIIEIIRVRHNNAVRTIYTTGLDKTELTGLYGSGIARRIFDRAAVVAWKGTTL